MVRVAQCLAFSENKPLDETHVRRVICETQKFNAHFE
jgi:hypothetical protein